LNSFESLMEKGFIVANGRTLKRQNPFPLAWLIDVTVNRVYQLLDLVEKADPKDVIVVIISYILMYATFIILFYNMRRLGSKFTLAFIVLLHGAFSLMCALVVAKVFDIHPTLIMLSETIPFLVVTIGFEKPVVLTNSIISAEVDANLFVKDATNNDLLRKGFVSELAKAKIAKGVEQVGPIIVRNYLTEIGVLVVTYFMGIEGLSDFCGLAAFILIFDMMFLFTLYIAVLALKLEVIRIRQSSKETKTSSQVEEQETDAVRQVKWMPLRVLSDTLCSSMFSRKSTCDKNADRSNVIDPSITRRVKCILFAGLLCIQALNFFSSSNLLPWTPYANPFGIQHVDISEHTVSSILEWFVSYSSLSSKRLKSVIFEADIPSNMFITSPARHGSSNVQSTHDGSNSEANLVWLMLLASLCGNMFVLARNKSLTSLKNISSIESVVQVTGGKPSEPFRSSNSCKYVSDYPQEVSKENPNIQSPTPTTTAPPAAAPAVPAPIKQNLPAELSTLPEEQLAQLVASNQIPMHSLEKLLGNDYEKAILVRRMAITSYLSKDSNSTEPVQITGLPYQQYDYQKVHGACCENVIGYLPLPVGIAGPFLIDGKEYMIPMATTEGCLVASTSRGAKAMAKSGGVQTVLTRDGMTRGPVLELDSILEANRCRHWVEAEGGFDILKKEFDGTSRFARLQKVKIVLAGKLIYMRFETITGDAMGMNMISKGCEAALAELKNVFPSLKIISLSGNYCTDKKPAAINWIEGRGKSVVASCTVTGDIVKKVLKTTVTDLCELNLKKNLIGSAMAGSVGGFNAHASNIVTAIFLATGQDPAQNVESSNCITIMEPVNGGEDLHISVTMPSIEVGTVGGGTGLSPQGSMLKLLGVCGPNRENPGENARTLARLVAAGVLAGELSLCSALAAGHLVKSHMQHNRKKPTTGENQNDICKDKIIQSLSVKDKTAVLSDTSSIVNNSTGDDKTKSSPVESKPIVGSCLSS